MAEGGIEKPHDQLKMTEVEMINYLESTGKFEIKAVGTPKVKPEPQIAEGSNYFGRHFSSQVPKIPQFSGISTIPKGEISYPEWRFEVNCLLNDPEMSDSIILQAVRSSLRGTARKMLLPMGESASARQIINKLDALYGDTSSNEMLMQEFFNLSQNSDESVTEYSCRLELALQSAIENGYLAPDKRDCHLRHQLWHGLFSERLKDQTHHKFDSVDNYDQLLKEIRVVERGLSISSKPKNSVSRKAQQHALVTEDKVSELEKRFDEKLGKLEKRIEERMDTKFDQVLTRLDTLANPSQQFRQPNRNSRFHSHRNNYRSASRGTGQSYTSHRGQNFAKNWGNNPKA